MPNFTLKELAEKIGAQVRGDNEAVVSSIGTLSGATKGQISFLANSKYRSHLSETNATAVIVSPEDAEFCPNNALIMQNAYVGFALAAQLLDTTPQCAVNIAPSAVISSDASLGMNVAIGANAVVESGADIGDNVQIGPGCFVGKNATIGANSKLWANVSVYHNCVIGADCLIQSGAVIGSDGFGYANDAGNWIKIPQLGRAVLGDKVEIGANSTIDRGALEDTVIEHGVIIDNLVQIAHNVVVGAYSAIAACSVIAGSTTMGKYCVVAGMVGINGHISITDKVTFTGFCMVTKNITEPGVYSSGVPATTNKEWRKNMIGLRNIGDLTQRVKAIEKKLEG